jgi:HlyD family secretion protein
VLVRLPGKPAIFAISGTNFVHLTYSITDKPKQGAPVANGKKRSKRLFYILGAVAVVVIIVIGLVAATHTGTKLDQSKLGKVEKGDLAKSVVATGKIEAITKVEVKSKASGIVEKLLVDYGDTVKKGQLLA